SSADCRWASRRSSARTSRPLSWLLMEERTITSPPQALGAEAVSLRQRLIQFNTVNPPGNEAEAQNYLMGALSETGWECELLAAEPQRPNLVARLPGESE